MKAPTAKPLWDRLRNVAAVLAYSVLAFAAYVALVVIVTRQFDLGFDSYD